MTGWDAAPWLGWLATGGVWLYRTYLPATPPAPPVDPAIEGWRQVLMTSAGEVESVRRVKDGSAPMRIERGHGRTRTWYRLTHVDGLSLMYKPEPR